MSVNAGTKTVTSTASTVGVATGREYLRLTNESLVNRCRAGDSDITAEAGVIIEPGQTVEFRSLPSENKAVYVLSEGAAVELAYYEVLSS